MSGNAVRDRHVVIRAERADGGTVQVAVEDSGHGFSAEALERIFELFHTTKPDGLGLGLPICRSIIVAHGGRLWAENNPKRGATIRFTLAIEKTADSLAPRRET
jgi:signal transduction histidine kinase